MVRLIMGVKGSGKTKQLIELINAAAKDEAGNVVCIEPKRDMSYNIHYNIRLIDAQEYDLHSYEVFRGFISGLYAGIQTADEATEYLIAVQIVFLRVDQADVVVNIVGHVTLRLNADHIAGLILRGSVDEFDELLGFAGTLDAHNQSNHNRSLLS